jgi:class 3 adenylate cyclase
MIAAIAAVSIFAMIVVAYFFYECFVRQWDSRVRGVADVSGGIVSSLFPSHIRGQLLDQHEAKTSASARVLGSGTKHIADYFPDTTVLYADIVGFTSWSAVRPPEQVFTLLETLYGCFDRIASRRGVYKVETIGDCYVAVTGLPDPQPLHALIMTEFAIECIQRMTSLVRKLQGKLGEGTEDLSMRLGLHSGPVTAGVLRGERSRFQLFGETVKTASFIEHSGQRNRIHVSNTTAQDLQSTTTGSRLVPRKDMIELQGRGMMQTFWVQLPGDGEWEEIEFTVSEP